MTLSGNILIIDDEPNLRQTFTRILKQAGCNVTTAADGPEALKRLAGTVYDLAYLDIHLPGMDGLQVLKEIRRLYPQLPVILFTGHASLQSAMDAIRLGAVDYLLKPVDPENLLARTGGAGASSQHGPRSLRRCEPGQVPRVCSQSPHESGDTPGGRPSL